jgi:hypothetical protein
VSVGVSWVCVWGGVWMWANGEGVGVVIVVLLFSGLVGTLVGSTDRMDVDREGGRAYVAESVSLRIAPLLTYNRPPSYM